MLISVIFGIVGIICMVFGWLIWRKEKISLLHDYHYDKVTEENKKAFCTLSGIGVFVIGLGIFMSGVLACIVNSALCAIPFGVGFVIGVAILICAGQKYNR